MVALFVILMFLGFLLADYVVQSLGARHAAVPAPAEVPWRVPQDLYLSEGHTWSRPDSSVGLKLGADALIARALGVVERVVLPNLGALVKAGQTLFELHHNGRYLTIPSSITGRVVALNPELGKRPELVVRDPYRSGWICAITPTQSNGEAGSIRSGANAVAWLEQEFHRFREFLSLQVAPDPILSASRPDGGLPSVGSLTYLSGDGWRAFEAEFLRATASPPLP